MPLGVSRFYFRLSVHCGFELGLGCMVGYVRWPLPGSPLFQNSRVPVFKILGRGKRGIISRLGIQIIMKFVSGFIFRILFVIRG